MQNVTEKAEGVLERTAESLESAAESVRDAAGETAGKISSLANEAGKKLDSSAEYVRNFDLLSGLRQRAYKNPLEGLAMAAVFGFVIGLMWRRSRHQAD